MGLGQWVEATIEDLAVSVNSGTSWPGGFGPPTVDWDTSFPAEPKTGPVDGEGHPTFDPANDDLDGDGKWDPVGYEVKTGGPSVYIDFDWPQRIEVTAEKISCRSASTCIWRAVSRSARARWRWWSGHGAAGGRGQPGGRPL